MLKALKQATLGTLKSSGVFTLVKSSGWRQRRLLILAYHGISLADEHLWNGGQYMSAEVFRERLCLLRKNSCAVLPLAEGLARLYAGDLPERSVAITFDDGTYDFYQRAYPLLREFDYPATLYLTTFYSQFNRPVFNSACSYLLWKGREQTLDLKSIIGSDRTVNLSTDEARDSVLVEIRRFTRERNMSAEEKDQLAASIAARLNVDYDALRENRILHLMQPREVKSLALGGVDIQLHTHRHRTPMNRELFLREIEDNRKNIREMTGESPAHFCYPSGVWDYAFLPWLKEAGIKSATTCDFGLAAASSDPLLLPRLVDVSALSPIEFESWLTGISVALPRRRALKKNAA
jgi:peptidoglycan/xylan/chitin deacetylase (PgdA/CDA1 family)